MRNRHATEQYSPHFRSFELHPEMLLGHRVLRKVRRMITPACAMMPGFLVGA
jgi:hypothetical protein